MSAGWKLPPAVTMVYAEPAVQKSARDNTASIATAISRSMRGEGISGSMLLIIDKSIISRFPEYEYLKMKKLQREIRKRNKSLAALTVALVSPAQDSSAADTLFTCLTCQSPTYNAFVYLADGEDVYKHSADSGGVGNLATTLRDMRRDPFYNLKISGKRRRSTASAYSALGGMEDDAVEVLEGPSGVSGSIDGFLERRLASDPLRLMRRRSHRPISDHERLMRRIDIVAGKMNCSGRDTDGGFS